METSLKTGFAQIFSCCPKNLSCPKFGGAAAPLAPPPARTPMIWDLTYISQSLDKFCRLVSNVQVMDDFLEFSMLLYSKKRDCLY